MYMEELTCFHKVFYQYQHFGWKYAVAKRLVPVCSEFSLQIILFVFSMLGLHYQSVLFGDFQYDFFLTHELFRSGF